jgi:hypothetical protein
VEALEERRLLTAAVNAALGAAMSSPGQAVAGLTTNMRVAPFVDLTAQVLAYPKATITIGKHQKASSATVKVVDVGTVVATGLLSVNLYASVDQTLDSSDLLLFQTRPAKVRIAAGKSKTVRVSGKLPATFPSGNFYLLGQVNPSGAIVESDTTNNVGVSASTVTVNNPAVPPGPGLAGPLAVNDTVVQVGSSNVLHFSVPVAGATSSTTVEVDELDSSGNSLGKLVQLFDTGSAINRDSVAGDGNFSGVVTLNFSAPGQRFFASKVIDPILPAALQSPTVTVSGNAPLTQEQVSADKADFDNISQAADNAKASGTSAQGILDAVQAALQSDSNVVQSSIVVSNGTIDWLNVDGMEQMVDTTFSPDSLGGGGITAGGPQNLVGLPGGNSTPARALTPLDSTPATDPSKNAIVLSPFVWQFGSLDPGNLITQALRGKGYTVTYKADVNQTDENVSLSDFENLGGHAAVVICAHGMLVRDTVVINSGQQIDSASLVLYGEELATRQLILNTIPGVGKFFVIRPSFVEDHNGPMDGAVVYLNTCFGTANRTMANVFLGAGAGVVLGYSKTVSDVFANSHGLGAFNTLLQDTNNTVGDIPGINSDRDTILNSNAQFQAMFDLKATLPQPNQLKNMQLYIQYSWPQTQRDLDTNTSFLGGTVGYALPGGPYLDWNGDNTSAGGAESVTIDLYQAWKDGKWSGSTTVTFGADWYTPASGAGGALASIALEDTSTLDFTQVFQKQLSPGQETSGSETLGGTITLTLSGDPLNPIVSMSVS